MPILRFKWWTCLNKIYYPYFRLSEDLDFTIPVDEAVVDSNTKRATFAQTMRDKIKHIANTMWRTLNDDKFHHKKAQWNKDLAKKEKTYLKYILTYSSVVDQSNQTIKIEITYATKQYFPSKTLPIVSCFVDPVLEEDVFPAQSIQCLDIAEMVTEKCRAAMTRRVPAIRDFFDLWYLDKQGIDITKNKDIIIAKCHEVKELSWTLLENYDTLETQEISDLKPMLDSVYKFDLHNIYSKILWLQNEIKTHFS